MTERIFTMDLTPTGITSCILLDGIDISHLLRGIIVRSTVNNATEVELQPTRGARVQLIARLPEARVLIAEEPPPEHEP
jgi:hypothetical protein